MHTPHRKNWNFLGMFLGQGSSVLIKYRPLAQELATLISGLPSFREIYMSTVKRDHLNFSKPFLQCTIKLSFTFSCWLRSVSISTWIVFTSPTNHCIALHTCARNHKPSPGCILITNRVNLYVNCAANVENGSRVQQKDYAANNNDEISQKEKSLRSIKELLVWLNNSVVIISSGVISRYQCGLYHAKLNYSISSSGNTNH